MELPWVIIVTGPPCTGKTSLGKRLAHHNIRFNRLGEQYRFYPLQVFCRAEPAVILQRFIARAASSERHPGHVDHLTLEEVRRSLENDEFTALDIGGQVITVDTTDFAKIDYGQILRLLRQAVTKPVAS